MGWVAGLATIGAVEFMAAAVALFILRRLQVTNVYTIWQYHFCCCFTFTTIDVCDFTDKFTPTNSLSSTLTPTRDWHGQRSPTFWTALRYLFAYTRTCHSHPHSEKCRSIFLYFAIFPRGQHVTWRNCVGQSHWPIIIIFMRLYSNRQREIETR